MGMTSSTNADGGRRPPRCCCLLLWALDINGFVVAITDLGHVCILQVTWVTSAGFYFTITIVGSRSGCGCCCCGVLVALGGTDVMVTKMLIENVSTLLLMLLKDR